MKDFSMETIYDKNLYVDTKDFFKTLDDFHSDSEIIVENSTQKRNIKHTSATCDTIFSDYEQMFELLDSKDDLSFGFPFFHITEFENRKGFFENLS